MTSVWSRLAAFTTAILWFAVCRALCVPGSRSETGRSRSLADIGCYSIWTVPVRGTKPLYGLQDRILDVSRRDCLANGSNYCFGNDPGEMCLLYRYLFGYLGHLDRLDHLGRLSQHSIGSSFCILDCFHLLSTRSPVGLLGGPRVDRPKREPVTVTSTIIQTVTRIATQRATVVVAVIERSTVVSTVEVTVSSAATQTNIVWVTATATAVVKRAVTTPQNSNLVSLATSAFAVKPARSALSNGTSTGNPDGYGTTVDITSTFTVTSHAPSVVTLTTTASLIPPAPASSTTPTPTSSASTTPQPHPSQTLSTGAIAGITAGASVLGLLLAAFVILSIRRRLRGRHHHSPEPPPSPDAYQVPHYDEDRMFDMRQPTIPQILPHFATTTPAHHAAQFELPASVISRQQYNGNENGYLSVNQTGAQTRPNQHQRNGSGYTTLVGTPSPTSPGFGFMVGGKKEDHQHHHHQHETDIAEVQGTTPKNLATHRPERAEVDGNGMGPVGARPVSSSPPPVPARAPGRRGPIGELEGGRTAAREFARWT
ncbi:uncharacterized protein B0T15DRAFT_506761 [Chaetomium strumarium]|uniref:Mid2 domain-containing protein n=1 Tax=Chaetomium strumarium TaxID=1170767 RepID=A0AAJ0H1L1_9PEZI|nr:hypothetical protein B0T15DRAFT_506761 [Chaetomium strumarium]